jgi:hypothetical protein
MLSSQPPPSDVGGRGREAGGGGRLLGGTGRLVIAGDGRVTGGRLVDGGPSSSLGGLVVEPAVVELVVIGSGLAVDVVGDLFGLFRFLLFRKQGLNILAQKP